MNSTVTSLQRVGVPDNLIRWVCRVLASRRNGR